MKFCVSLLLLLLFDTLQGSTLPHVRKVRALNTTLQTNFNGTYERINPCTNAEIESSSYIASHEFHHHTNEDNWSDYTHKCSAIISGFLQAIGNLVRFNNKQNGLFNFHINTSISQKQVGHHEAGKCCESMPTILIQATDCEVTPKKSKNIEKEAEEKTVTERKYHGPVCLLNIRKKAGPGTVSGTASYDQNTDEINPSVINSNQKIPQNEYHGTEESLKEVWNPVKNSLGDTSETTIVEGSQTVPNGVRQRTKTTFEQASKEFENPAAPLPESELQVVPVTTTYESSQPKFGLENSPEFQATAFENANERRNFNPPDATPNTPYTPQPSSSGFGNPPQPVVSIRNEELIIKNQFPPALPSEQGLPAMYPQQPSSDNLDRRVPGPLLREPLPNSYPNQMPVFLPPSQAKVNPQGGPSYPQNSPPFKPTYNGQNPNLEFNVNYPPQSVQAPPVENSFDLPQPVQPSPVGNSVDLPPPVQAPPRGNSFDLPPQVQAPPMRNSFDLPPPVQAPPMGNSFDLPQPVQPSPVGNSVDLPPPVQAPPRGNSFDLPQPVQPSPVGNSVDLPPPVQAPPMRNSFDLPPQVQAPPMRNSFDLPPQVQAPPTGNSFDLPPPDYNPSEVGFTKTQAPGQISDMTRTVENNFTPDQKQTITLEKVETTYYNDQPMNYNQVPRAPLPETQPEFLPTKPLFLPPESQQKLPDYPSEIARNEQPPMNSMEVLPPDTVAPKDAVFSDTPAIPNGGVGATFNLPVANSSQPVIPPNFQPPIAPALTAPQYKPSVIRPRVDSTIFRQKVGIPRFRIRTKQVPGPRKISDNSPITSFSNQPPSNTFIQPAPVGNVSPSNDFPEQSRNKFDTPQQPDSTGLVPIENTPSQPTPTLGPQPLPAFTGQLPKNEMFGAVTQNFQKIVPADDIPLQSPPVVAPTTDIISQTAAKDSQFDYPTSTEKPEQSVSGLVPNNIGNQLSELTTYDKPILNSNDFQPETQSYFTEPSDRNLDYTTQTPFYDSIPAAYKSEPESQPGLIPNVQNLSERPIAPAPEQAFPPSGLESLPTTPLRAELPPSSLDVTRTESYSEQTRSEFGSTPKNSEFVNPPRNGFQMVAPRPGPQFMPQEQTFGDDRYRVPMQRPNPIPEISNPSSADLPPFESNPVTPVQQQPQFYLNQNGDVQQPLPETAPTSQTFSQTATQQQYRTTGPDANKFPNAVPPQGQPTTVVYPQLRTQPGVPNYEIQTGNQPPNAPNQPPNGRVTDEFYPERPRNENQPFQTAPQSVFPNQSPDVQLPSAETQGQFINPETSSAESTPNTLLEMNKVGVTEYQSNIPPAAPGAGDSFPREYPPVEQQSAGFDGPQMPQQNYPNPGFPSGQVLPVDLPATQAPVPQSLSGQSDSNLNYDGVQPNGILQSEPRMPGNDQFSSQTNSNLQSIALPPQMGPMNSQNGVNPNELQTFVPSVSPQQTGVGPFPPAPLQTVPENSQVNNFPLGSAFGSTVSTPEVLAKETDSLMPNPDQPSGVSQTERQDPNTQDQFPPAVPPQFTTQPSGEATTDYPNPYQPQPPEDYIGGVPGVQTTNRMLTSIDEYRTPAPTAQEPLNYFGERPDDVAQTTPPPFQADQFLTSSQYQSEYVQNNAAMYSPNLAPRPQPQPSFDNLTEFPGDKPAGNTTQTPLPSEIKPETFGSQPPRQTALTETNIPDTDNAKTPDTRPKPGSLDYLGPQIYPNFDVPTPAVNYPGQDGRTLPPTADSITRDMTYQTTNPAFTPSQTAPPLGINPKEIVFNSNSSYFSTAMTPSEGFGMQPFRQASALIASPQPQSTTVKYNERIRIPQYQIPTASNPQPQATLKYASRHSGDNTKEGLLDSAAWTFPGPQEAMVTAPPPQYQTTPLRSQFPPSNVEFNNGNKGRPFRPTQKQLVPVTQSSVTPSFEQQEHYSNGNTTTVVVEEINTTDFPRELASSPFEDQLAYADKLLNSSTPVHEHEQGMGQKPQRIHFSPTKTRELVTESFVTPPTPFAIQNPSQIQSSSLTNSGERGTDSPVGRPTQIEQEIKIHPQRQIQSFPSTTIRELTTDPLVSPPPPFQLKTDDQPQHQLQSFSSTNMREIIADSPVMPPPLFEQQIDVQPQNEPRPFSSTISRDMITYSLVTPPPPLEPQVEDQPQPQIQSSTSTREDILNSPVTVSPLFQHQTDALPQTQLQPFSSTISREVITDSLVSPLPPFQPQIEDQPQPQIQSSTSTREDIPNSPVTVSPLFQHQTDALPQTQLQPFSSTISREVITDSLVSPPPPFQSQIEDQPQSQDQELDPTNIREDITVPSITGPPSLQQEIEVQTQPQLQPFPSTNIKEAKVTSPFTPRPPFPQKFVDQPQSEFQYSTTITREDITAPLVAPTPSFQPQTDVQPQTQLQPFYSANIQELRTGSPVPAPPFEQQTDVQPQTELQPFSVTISKEVITDSRVTPPPPFQQEIESQFQPQVEKFQSTGIGEVITVPPVRSPSPSQTKIQTQQQFRIISSTNTREGTADSPVTSSTPFPQQTDLPQTHFQPFSSTISEEIVTDSLVRPPSAIQPQIKVRPQPQLQSFPSTNIEEVITTSPVTPTTPFPQQTVVQPDTELEYPTKIMREVVTDSLVTPPPQFPQVEVLTQPQALSKNEMEIMKDPPVTLPHPLTQQIDVQPQTHPQPYSSTISIETVTDSFMSPPPTSQPVIEVTSEPKEFYTTSMREDINDSPVTPPPSVQQQTQLQPFSSTISREVITDSLVSPPPPFEPQIKDQPQFQIKSFPSTNVEELRTDSLVPERPLEQQIGFQPQPKLEGFDSTNNQEIVTEHPGMIPPPFEQQTNVQPPIELQPFSSTISREVITDSLVRPTPPYQPQIEVSPQPQVQSFPSTNTRVIIPDSPVIPPPPVQQEPDVQQQTQLQPFSSTISREIITDSLVSPAPPFQTNTEDQSQPKFEGFDSTNIREVVSEPPGMIPPPFEQQTDVQPPIELQPFSSTISREFITDSLVSPPPPYQPQNEVLPQPQVQSFSSTNTREVIPVSPVIPPPPVQQQLDVQQQTQPRFSSTISKEVITESLVSPSPPFEPQIEVTSQPQPKEFYKTSIIEDITASPVTPPPRVQQQLDVQQQTQLQPFSSTISREVITDSLVRPPPPYQPQIEVRPQPQVQSFSSTNTREIIPDSPVTPPPPPQQIYVQQQTDLQPFSVTISREVITDSLVTQPPPFEPQIEGQSEPQPPAPSSSNMRDIMTDSLVSPPPLVQQPLESQLQPELQSYSSTSSKKIVTDSLVIPSPPLPQVEVQPQSERKSFSSTNPSAVLSDFRVNPPTLFQQDVEKQRQRELQNFSSRNVTETVSDSVVNESTSLQGGREQVQNELHAFSTGNSTEVAADSLVNPAAKLEKHVAQELQTQRTRYTTTNTKEVITESFLPTSESTYVESGNDGQLKSVTISSGPNGNPHGKRTEIVEETITNDFPDLTEFSSLEDEFIFADKLLNNSTPILKTTSVINVSPFGKKTEENAVTTAVETQKPVDQIPVSTMFENGVSPIKSTRINYDQVPPIQSPGESDVVVASNLNSPRADRQSFKSDLGPIYGPKYSQSGPTTVSSLGSDQTVSSDFQTSERTVLFTPIMTPDNQEPHFNPLLQTLETHLNFPLHEPPEPSSSKPGPRRATPLPLLGHPYPQLRPTLPSETTKRDTGPYLIKSQNSENAAREMESAPRHDPPVPVSNPTDPSNGPDPLKVLMNSSLDKMVPAPSGGNFWSI